MSAPDEFWNREPNTLGTGKVLEWLKKHDILSLAVPLQRRGRGIASQLIQKAEEQARSRGVEAVYLLTTTAEGFFARRGYHKVDRDGVPEAIKETAEFQSLCPASAVCMVKHLGAAQ